MSGSGLANHAGPRYSSSRFLEEGEAAPSHSGLEPDYERDGGVDSSPRHHFAATAAAALACAPTSSGSFILANSLQVDTHFYFEYY